MVPPKEKFGKGVADFQHYMVQRLKADRDEVLESAREVVENSRANMNSQTRIHRASQAPAAASKPADAGVDARRRTEVGQPGQRFHIAQEQAAVLNLCRPRFSSLRRVLLVCTTFYE